jgi:hypothetical protein
MESQFQPTHIALLDSCTVLIGRVWNSIPRCLTQVGFPRAANQDCVESTVGGARRKMKLHEAKPYGVLAPGLA